MHRASCRPTAVWRGWSMGSGSSSPTTTGASPIRAWRCGTTPGSTGRTVRWCRCSSCRRRHRFRRCRSPAPSCSPSYCSSGGGDDDCRLPIASTASRSRSLRNRRKHHKEDCWLGTGALDVAVDDDGGLGADPRGGGADRTHPVGDGRGRGHGHAVVHHQGRPAGSALPAAGAAEEPSRPTEGRCRRTRAAAAVTAPSWRC